MYPYQNLVSQFMLKGIHSCLPQVSPSLTLQTTITLLWFYLEEYG